MPLTGLWVAHNPDFNSVARVCQLQLGFLFSGNALSVRGKGASIQKGPLQFAVLIRELNSLHLSLYFFHNRQYKALGLPPLFILNLFQTGKYIVSSRFRTLLLYSHSILIIDILHTFTSVSERFFAISSHSTSLAYRVKTACFRFLPCDAMRKNVLTLKWKYEEYIIRLNRMWVK